MNSPLRRIRWFFLLAASFLLLLGSFSLEARDQRARPTPTPEWAAAGKSHKPPLWSSTQTMTAHENAFAHWRKHKEEFPEFTHASEYIRAANEFVTRPPPGTLTKYRSNGDTLYYHPATNTFAVKNARGAPRTFFRPAAGRAYWNRQ